MHIMSTIFGSLEVFATIFITFMLFRIPVRPYLKEIIIGSFALGVAATLALDIFQAPFIWYEVFELVFLILFHIYYLKLPTFYSALIAISGYIVSSVTLVIIAFALTSTNMLEAQDIMYNSQTTMFVQSIMFALNISFFSVFYKYGYGFSFIEERFDFKSDEDRRSSALILSTILLSLIVLGIVFYIGATGDYSIGYVFVIVQLILMTIVMWLWYMRANKQHEGHYKKYMFMD